MPKNLSVTTKKKSLKKIYFLTNTLGQQPLTALYNNLPKPQKKKIMKRTGNSKTTLQPHREHFFFCFSQLEFYVDFKHVRTI